MTMATITENATEPTTEAWTSRPTAAHQRDLATGLVGFDVYAGELETRAIERNAEFHATIVERLTVSSPRLADADSVDAT
jgi:hypothetical protein